MAVVYFTSNASTGAGSLVEAIANAQPGDAIRPDESVFERGATIEIVLASQLIIDKNLTLDASPFRVRLNGGGTLQCVNVLNGAEATFTAFDFVNGYSAGRSGGCDCGDKTTVTFNRCIFAGCCANVGAAFVAQQATVRLVDSLVTGCYSNNYAAIYQNSITPQKLDVIGSTIIGNYSGGGVRAFNNLRTPYVERFQNNIVGPSVVNNASVGVEASVVGFVVSPPNVLTLENWSTELWKSWNLRLLDDASPSPSSYRDSGDVGAMSRYDLDGNFRGRETNGVATCSPGAYETIQADLFWIGRDATGAETVSPSFLTSDGWAASRFATVSGDVAPQVGQKLFVGSDAVFVDTPVQGAFLKIGGYTVVSSGTGDTEPIATTIGFGATFTISMPVTLQRVGGFVKFNWTSGNVTVNTDVTTSELSIPSSASITVNGAFVSIETLRVSNSSTVAFSGSNAILAATETATVGDATFIGTGYFATPTGTDTSSASFAETVRDCDYGANVSSFSASPDTATAALLSWIKQNSTPSVLIEEANGSAWNVVSNRATGDSLSVDISVPKTFRLFDGENFFTASARPYGTAYELAEEQTIGYLKTLISTGYLN